MAAQTDSFTELIAMAEGQQGFFTTSQAIAAGFADNTHPYHVCAGHWIRHCRGVYRLAHYPPPEDGEIVGWYLWSRKRSGEPQGVYSHQTALSLYELSDIMPAKLHMTVPPTFRRNSAIPKVLVLHKAALDDADIREMRGFRITRPFPTILTLAREERIAQNLIRDALSQARSRGLVLAREIDPATRDMTLPDWFRKLLKSPRS